MRRAMITGSTSTSLSPSWRPNCPITERRNQGENVEEICTIPLDSWSLGASSWGQSLREETPFYKELTSRDNGKRFAEEDVESSEMRVSSSFERTKSALARSSFGEHIEMIGCDSRSSVYTHTRSTRRIRERTVHGIVRAGCDTRTCSCISRSVFDHRTGTPPRPERGRSSALRINASVNVSVRGSGAIRRGRLIKPFRCRCPVVAVRATEA